MSISDYLEKLGQPSSPRVNEGEWTSILDEFEDTRDQSNGDTTNQYNDIDPNLLATAPWPSLLDYYSAPGPSRLRRATSTGSPKRDESDSQNDSQGSAGGVGVASSLGERVKAHLTIPSAYYSLIHLLSSSRSNEDIQSELVEILGFEGQGLSLVEELLRPGARQEVVETDETSDHKKSKKTNGNSRIGGTGYLPSARLTVTAARGKGKKQNIDIADVIGSHEDIERRIQEQLDRPKAMFHEDGPRIVEHEILPHVYTGTNSGIASMSHGGRLALPMGTVREMYDTFEEVIVPPPKTVPPTLKEKPVRIADLPPLARGCFPKYVTLNRMQSIVQPIAMNTNENMLICAPTGAGKTDVALMAILRVLSQNLLPGHSSHPSGFSINLPTFKIIYVAPMKALAAEITRKFGKRLAWLGVKVRELTGDMQLTRQEIAETQVIVTTPEKWDVVTRKPTGEGELASKVKLLIIDEVHLLNEERGAVIETIVARTVRQVESSQSLIRIVGLSATLPNYVDVSDFLRVNRYQGLFFFDASFRPVPLEQHFIGVAGKPRSQASMRNMDQVVFDKVSQLVQDGHQVMVFVHARKETVKTAQKLKEMAMEEGMLGAFETVEHPKHGFYRRDISTSRNKEMKELFDSGFGIHHAGMLRSDRNMMERMFEDNAIKVLCCTSTLAWGVNLPAHAVVIKGTQVYDSGRGAFVDLSVLDVLQIFGRAGRPGYETSGVGYICTTQDKLDQYLQNIMSQHPIESKFIPGMVDALNAEVSLGTIANVSEAIQWLGYTYLFVRMRREPFIYGMPHDEPKDDPQLGNKRNELIVQAARQLAAAKMIRFEEISNTFVISDLGRIAAKYYLKYQTMEIFNTMFHAKMKNADMFAMLCQATEFDQIQIRETEIEELTAILESDHCPMEVKGGTTNKHGKVNILLQAHISKVYLEDFALVSDAAYVAQNAARIIRALLEIALSRNWANCALLLIDLSKAIEHRMWPYEHPLAQITTLQRETLHNLRQYADDTEIVDLREMESKAIGDMIRMNEKHGQAIRDAAIMFPTVGVEYALRPLSHDLLQISVCVRPLFQWNAKVSSSGEPFYIWIQDEEGINILQWRSVLMRQSTTKVDIDFLIPLTDKPPVSYTIISASDRWLGSDDTRLVPLEGLVMPTPTADTTPLLDIPYLHISALDDPSLEGMYRPFIQTMNGIQSQAFWTLYHTQMNVLVSAPVSSGKSFLGEVAIWHAFRHDAEARILVVVPNRNAAQETAARIRSVMPKGKAITIQTLTSTADIMTHTATSRLIAITTPSILLRLDEKAHTTFTRNQSLVLLEDLHLLDEYYELCVTRILPIAKPSRTRIVGLTSSLNDPSDLASWLNVDHSSRYCFSPRDRGSPLAVSIKTFTIPHSTTLLKSMVKPAYDILKRTTGQTILFVPSKQACRNVASDLVTQSGTEMDLNGFLSAEREEVEPLLERLRDVELFEPILHGIGYILPGTPPRDLSLVLELFASGVLKALIVPREACWTLPLKAQNVIIMSAQYIHTTPPPISERIVVNYSRTELVKMQGFAVGSAHQSASGRMFVMCQSEQSVGISRVLNDGLPLESTLPALLRRESSDTTLETALNNMMRSRAAPPRPQRDRPRRPDLRKRDMVDLLNWTYFAKRAETNPSYYDLHKGSEEMEVSRWVDEWVRKGGEEFAEGYGNDGSLNGSGSKSENSGHSTRSGLGSASGDDVRENGLAIGNEKKDDGIEVDQEVNRDTIVGEADGETLTGEPEVEAA